MKKLITLAAASVALTLSLAGCGDGETTASEPEPEPAPDQIVGTWEAAGIVEESLGFIEVDEAVVDFEFSTDGTFEISFGTEDNFSTEEGTWAVRAGNSDVYDLDSLHFDGSVEIQYLTDIGQDALMFKLDEYVVACEKTKSLSSDGATVEVAKEKLSDSQLEEIAVNELYRRISSIADDHNGIDAGSCRYEIANIEREDNGTVLIYGNVTFYDKYGNVTKYGGDYNRGFSVRTTGYGGNTYFDWQ